VTFAVVRGFQNWVFRSLIGVLRNILLSTVHFCFFWFCTCVGLLWDGIGWDGIGTWIWGFGGFGKKICGVEGHLLVHVGIFYFSGGCCFVQAPEKCGFDARLGGFLTSLEIDGVFVCGDLSSGVVWTLCSLLATFAFPEGVVR
jgi:hypothetical protein